jgi:hypothetical protein
MGLSLRKAKRSGGMTMAVIPPSIAGDFSISDLIREATQRAIIVHHVVDRSEAIKTPSMSGLMLAEEVQPGLLLSGYDLTYIEAGRFEAEIERSVFVGFCSAERLSRCKSKAMRRSELNSSSQ